MPNFYMLIGVPAAGKSTYVKEQTAINPDLVVISSDDIIDECAAARNQTYTEVFREVAGFAAKLSEQRAKEAFATGKDVIWDQTNTSVKSRKGKLVMVPENYTKWAIYFPVPDSKEHERRLASRVGKFIPPHIVKSMIDALQYPSFSEGFNNIICRN